MNANDTRNRKNILEKVFDTTQIQRLTTGTEGKKPQCLILDEIDGAQDGEGRSAIKALCDYVTGKIGNKKRQKGKKENKNENEENKETYQKKSDSENDSDDNIIKDTEEDTQKRKKKGPTIKRPIKLSNSVNYFEIAAWRQFLHLSDNCTAAQPS